MKIIRSKNKTGLTLLEIMVVFVITGIIIAFAVPQFNKTINTARDRNAKTVMYSIISAVKIYIKRSGYADATIDTVKDLNIKLGLDISEDEYGKVVLNILEGRVETDEDTGEETVYPDMFEIYLYPKALKTTPPSYPYHYFYSTFNLGIGGPAGPVCVDDEYTCP